MERLIQQVQETQKILTGPGVEWSASSTTIQELAMAVEAIDDSSQMKDAVRQILPLANDIGKQLTAIRSKLVIEVCNSLTRIVEVTRKDFQELANALLPHLADTAKGATAAIRQPGAKLFHIITEKVRYDLQKFKKIYYEAPQDKVRVLLMDQLHAVSVYWEREEVEPYYSDMLDIFRRGLHDAAENVRITCRDSLCSFASCWPERVDEMVDIAPPRQHIRLVQEKSNSAIAVAILKRYPELESKQKKTPLSAKDIAKQRSLFRKSQTPQKESVEIHVATPPSKHATARFKDLPEDITQNSTEQSLRRQLFQSTTLENESKQDQPFDQFISLADDRTEPLNRNLHHRLPTSIPKPTGSTRTDDGRRSRLEVKPEGSRILMARSRSPTVRSKSPGLPTTTKSPARPMAVSSSQDSRLELSTAQTRIPWPSTTSSSQDVGPELSTTLNSNPLPTTVSNSHDSSPEQPITQRNLLQRRPSPLYNQREPASGTEHRVARDRDQPTQSVPMDETHHSKGVILRARHDHSTEHKLAMDEDRLPRFHEDSRSLDAEVKRNPVVTSADASEIHESAPRQMRQRLSTIHTDGINTAQVADDQSVEVDTTHPHATDGDVINAERLETRASGQQSPQKSTVKLEKDTLHNVQDIRQRLTSLRVIANKDARGIPFTISPGVNQAPTASDRQPFTQKSMHTLQRNEQNKETKAADVFVRRGSTSYQDKHGHHLNGNPPPSHSIHTAIPFNREPSPQRSWSAENLGNQSGGEHVHDGQDITTQRHKPMKAENTSGIRGDAADSFVTNIEPSPISHNTSGNEGSITSHQGDLNRIPIQRSNPFAVRHQKPSNGRRPHDPESMSTRIRSEQLREPTENLNREHPYHAGQIDQKGGFDIKMHQGAPQSHDQFNLRNRRPRASQQQKSNQVDNIEQATHVVSEKSQENVSSNESTNEQYLRPLSRRSASSSVNQPSQTSKWVTNFVMTVILILGGIFGIAGLLHAATTMRDSHEYHQSFMVRIGKFEKSIAESHEAVKKLEENYATWSEYVRVLAEEDEANALFHLNTIQHEVEKWQKEMKEDLMEFRRSISVDVVEAALAPLHVQVPNATE